MKQNKVILLLALPLAILTAAVSIVGLLTPNFYSAETGNWQAQSLGQDLVDLCLIVPSLLLAMILAYRNNRMAFHVWGGVVLYLTYTFILYCFDVHFNRLFILYCLCLGLSFYSLLYYILSQGHSIIRLESKSFTRWVGIYFILLSILFYFLWLGEIIPSIIKGTIPQSTQEAGLFTNGVHVLDLSIVLPCIFITGFFLIRQKQWGFYLAPALLTFFILMDITIGILTVIMKMRGIESDLTLTAIMGVLALLSLSFLVWYSRCTKTNQS